MLDVYDLNPAWKTVREDGNSVVSDEVLLSIRHELCWVSQFIFHFWTLNEDKGKRNLISNWPTFIYKHLFKRKICWGSSIEKKNKMSQINFEFPHFYFQLVDVIRTGYKFVKVQHMLISYCNDFVLQKRHTLMSNEILAKQVCKINVVD